MAPTGAGLRSPACCVLTCSSGHYMELPTRPDPALGDSRAWLVGGFSSNSSGR